MSDVLDNVSAPDRGKSQNGQRILVAEDSSVTQDLLELVLSHRGHDVVMVGDGLAAQEALNTESFDIAFLDFHMPGRSGLEVARDFLATSSDEVRPHFVAITGDVEGLLQSQANCEHFDRVLPKPLDMDRVSELIDDLIAEGPARSEGWSDPRPLLADDMATTPQPFGNLDFRFLRWPEAAGRAALDAGGSNYDAILVSKPATPADLRPIWLARGMHLLPVIDLDGHLGARADLDASRVKGQIETVVGSLIDRFADARAGLHPDLLRSDDAEDKLLGRMHVMGDGLVPFLDGQERGLVGYNTICEADEVRRHSRDLVERGLLKRRFFDRLHQCSNCSSARFNIREECPDCRSGDQKEMSYLHHFRCAFQGPEADFRRGDDLICPKCARELRHFGSDYDRPGVVVMCGQCGVGTSEPVVGCTCLDCGTHTDGDVIATTDVHAYQPTDQAIGYIEGGRAYLGFARDSLRFADLPFELVVALNVEARKYNETGRNFALLTLSYEAEREVVRSAGARQFTQARALYLEALQQTLEAAQVARGQSYDFALLPGADPDHLRARSESLADAASRQVKHDLGVRIGVFGPEDIAG